MDEIVKATSGTPDTKQKMKIPLEEMKHENLVAQVKRQILFTQKAKVECDDLNSQISNLQMYKEENTALKNQCSELEDKLELNEKEFEEEKRKHKEILSTKENELSSLKDEAFRVSKERLEYAEQIQCLKTKNSTMAEMCHCLQQELADLTKNKVDKYELLLVTEERDSALNSLKQLESFLNEKDEHLLQLKSEVERIKGQNSDLLIKLDSLLQEIEMLTNQNNNVTEVKKTMVVSKIRNLFFELAFSCFLGVVFGFVFCFFIWMYYFISNFRQP